MSDLREAFEAVARLQGYIHLRADQAVQFAEDMDAIKTGLESALSANGGEGSRKLSVLAAQLHESARCLGVAQAKEDADAKEYWGQISEAKLEAISTHPAPPSVAVPEVDLRERVLNLLCSLGHQGVDMGEGQLYDIGEWGIKEAQELHTLLTAGGEVKQ